MRDPQITNRTLVYDGWYRLFVLELEAEGSGKYERHLLDHGSATAVLPFDPIRKVCVLVQQPRAPVLEAGEPALFEAIAGNLDSMSAELRAKEEAFEEAGVRLANLESVANVWSLCSVSSERLHLFLAEYSASDLTGAGGGLPEEGEYISVHEIGLRQLSAMVEAGLLTDAKTLILAQALLLRRPELFA